MFLKKGILLLFLLQGIFLHRVQAQVFNGRGDDRMPNGSDTSRNQKQIKTNDSLAIYYVTLQQNEHHTPDSTILLQHLHPFLGIWDRDLGNAGTAYQSLLFTPNMMPQMKLGMQHNQAYLFNKDSMTFYNTTRPYTDIYYWMGRKQEQCIQLFHTQNIKPNWNLSAAYRKLVSPGNFKYLRSNHDMAYLNSWFQSENKRYENKASIIYNKAQQDESGGILSEEQLTDISFRDRRLLPVRYEASSFSSNRSSVINSYRDASFNMMHQYFFGKTIKDSAQQDVFKPSFGIRHQFYSNLIYQYYEDQEPDSSEYGYIYIRDDSNKDSLYHKHFLSQVGNAFSLNQNFRLKDKVTALEAGYGLEYDFVNSKKGKVGYLNNFIFGKLSKEQLPGDRWQYHAFLKLYFTGNAKGNLLLDAQIGRSISDRLGHISLLFKQSVQSPDYKQAYYYYEPNADQTALSKTAINYIGLRYQLPRLKLQVAVQQYTVLNMQYVDTTLQVKQYNSLIAVSQGILSKAFHWRRYVLDNQVFLQQAPTASPVHVPVVGTLNRLYLQEKVFKQKLLIATGVEMRYNTPFLTDQYVPVFQSFAPQYNRTIANIPAFSYFFNFKIKRYRASICFDELQQLYAVNNLNYLNYPSPNLMIRFKMNWVFIN